MATIPDIFSNVHKGIRAAFFGACTALGRAGDDPDRNAEARQLLRDALRFVSHHGENEDLLLAPLLEARAPDVFERMTRAHARIHEHLEGIARDADTAPTVEIYHRTCGLLALYLDHMREEECELEPRIRATLSDDELVGFARGFIERTAPADQRMMLGWMIPAMTREDAGALLEKLPPMLARELAA